MDYRELLEKYNVLLEQVARLTKENIQLKAHLGLPKSEFIQNTSPAKITERNINDDESANRKSLSDVDNKSDVSSKIRLFMSFFRGREDVYAKRWENKNKGTSGYSPVCLNEWQPGLCAKPKIPCSKCENKFHVALDEDVIENHLRGNIVVGIYRLWLRMLIRCSRNSFQIWLERTYSSSVCFFGVHPLVVKKNFVASINSMVYLLFWFFWVNKK